MIPNRLQDWTVEHVVELARRGVYESDGFDLKEMLPHSNDESGKDRLRKSCAAFANSSGGFLVFGVADRNKPVTDRIVGVDSSIDFPARFGDFPSQCTPAVDWEFRNPPLRLRSGRVIHIVYIFSSWKVHAIGTPETGLIFPKRTNKGTEFMSYDEIRTMFLGYYEKRIKLQLLRAELQQIASDAAGLIIPPERATMEYGLPSIDLTVLETVLSDTYSITYSSPQLIQAMTQLRSVARMINNKVETFRFEVALPLANKAEVIRNHNDSIRRNCEVVVELCRRAVALLDQIIS